MPTKLDNNNIYNNYETHANTFMRKKLGHSQRESQIQAAELGAT